jgi:UDP-glucose 4-epimerase
MRSRSGKVLQGRVVLVTGGAGFIGSHFVEELYKRGAEQVVVVDSFFLGATGNLDKTLAAHDNLIIHRIDAGDFIALTEVVKKYKIQTIFDFATIPLPTSLEFPNWTVTSNVRTASTLAELVRTQIVEDIVHISSSEVYGSARYTPMDEKHPLIPQTPYASSKAAGELIIDSYRHTFGIDAMSIRPFNNFGPRQNTGSYAGVIPIIARKVLEGNTIEVYGDGEQTRDFIFVRETASFIADLYTKNPAERCINVATGVETSINQLIQWISEILDLPAAIVYMPPRPGDVKQHLASTALLNDVLGHVPAPINKENLSETIHWYRKKFA